MKFDPITSLASEDEIREALRSAFSHTRDGGILGAEALDDLDFWYRELLDAGRIDIYDDECRRHSRAKRGILMENQP